MSWLYEAVGWLLVVVGAWSAGWELASLAAGRTTVRSGYWRDVTFHLAWAVLGLVVITDDFEYKAFWWPLIALLSVCLVGFLMPYISMWRWSRRRRQSTGPTAEPS
jgi:hypothetical protein